MNKTISTLIGVVIGLTLGITVGAKAVTTLNDGDLLAQIKASFQAAGWTPPVMPAETPPTLPPTATKPTDVTGSLWTIMAPFNKVGATNSPENLYITPAQADSRYAPYLFMRNNAVVFKTPVNGVHSANSEYARTELREMKDLNWGNGSWTNKTGTHTLTTRQAITRQPVAKPEVVAAQIHDSSDDVMQVRLDASVLEVWWNDGNNKATLDSNYVLGTVYDLQIVASASHIKVFYNGVQKADISKSGSGWYFKEGSYCQSNLSKGDTASAYCEVEVYSLKVSHV